MCKVCGRDITGLHLCEGFSIDRGTDMENERGNYSGTGSEMFEKVPPFQDGQVTERISHSTGELSLRVQFEMALLDRLDQIIDLLTPKIEPAIEPEEPKEWWVHCPKGHSFKVPAPTRSGYFIYRCEECPNHTTFDWNWGRSELE